MIKSLKLYDFDTEIKVLYLLASSSSSLMGMGWEVPSYPVLHPRLLFNPKLQAWQIQAFVLQKSGSLQVMPPFQGNKLLTKNGLSTYFFLTSLEKVNSKKINLFINIQIRIINGFLEQMFVPEKGRGV